MGICQSEECFWKKVKHKNQVTEEFVVSGHSFPRDASAQTHMLIIAMDYKKTRQPLSCTIDAKNMEQLAQACGVEDLVVLMDKDKAGRAKPLTAKLAEDTIKAMAARCCEGDFFVFYYSGHGTQLKDVGVPEGADDESDGDEEDGSDEAYCFQDEYGQISKASCMTDDTFAMIMSDNMRDGVNLVVVSDCCHSDTICDFGKRCWREIPAISMSGCLDAETSGDIGVGGIFTHSMLLAIDNLSKMYKQACAVGDARIQKKTKEYSVEFLYDVTLQTKKKSFRTARQQFSIEDSDAHKPNSMRWPLIPNGPYVAPLNSRLRGATVRDAGIPDHVAELTDVSTLPSLEESLKEFVASFEDGEVPEEEEPSEDRPEDGV